MKKLAIVISSLLLIPAFAFATDQVIQIDRAHDMPSFLGNVPNEFIVVMKPDVGRLDVYQAASAVAHIGRSDFDLISDRFAVSGIKPQFVNARGKLASYHKIKIEAGTLDEAMRAYRGSPLVESVEPIGMHAMYATPNDGYFSYQWYHDQVSDHDIDSPEAWDNETGADATIVAILDSGTRYYHPDLGGVNASPTNVGASRGNMWINNAELNGSAGVDDDGNGYTDDWIGYDFIESTTSCWTGEDCNTQDNDPRDFNGHGTHTSGIFGMLTNDGYGMAGVAGGWGNGSQAEYGDGVKIMALRMGYSYSFGGQEYGVVLMDAAAEAFYYAADNGAKIASCSWGSSNSGGIGAAADYFIANGGIIVVAAGNDGAEVSPPYLNSRGDCISVAATDETDDGASFTTYGTWVNICAPGDNIYSTYHDHTDPNTNYWASMGGTSMATPMVAGVCALIWSQNPSWTATQVESQLYSSADNIDAYLSSQYIGKMGAGRINAYNAVNTGPVLPVANFSGSPTSGAMPLTVNFTDLSTGTPTGWSWDFGDGVGTSGAQNPMYTYDAAGPYTVSLTVTNAEGSDNETKVNYITVTEGGTVVDLALSDIPVSGSVSGTYASTHTSDNVRQAITEVQSGGKPSNRRSYCEHKWDFNVTGGSSVTFYVEAYRPTNAGGDNFEFAYSTDNVAFTSLVTVASATEQTYTAGLPGGLSGTVYIRVTDTNSDKGETDLATVYVDYMGIESVSGPVPLVADFAGSPTSGSAPLTVNFTDLSTGNPTSWSWNFGDGTSPSTAQNPMHVYTTADTYTVTLTVTNASGNDTETKTNYITVTDVGNTMYVFDMAVGRVKSGPNYLGTCTVTMYDNYSQPASGVTVFVTADGPTGGSYSGVTGAEGTVDFQTGGVKRPSGEWCFEVTNATHATLTYDAGSNNVTRSCEGGDVYGDGAQVILPDATGLDYNHPNPFNAQTEIAYSVAKAGQHRLEIFNLLGARVRTLADGYATPGEYSVVWDGRDQRGGVVASGTYFYRLTVNGEAFVRPMTLLK